MDGKKDQALAQSCANAPAALAKLPINVIVWFIIDSTAGLVLCRQGLSKSRDDGMVWKNTYEFIPANSFIASVRFPVT
jgi:hypothetical protein